MATYTLILTFLVLMWLGYGVLGVKVQFYGFFTGLVYESNATELCNNVPENKRDVPIRSIKTDTCVMVYYNLDCRSHSKKFNQDKSLGWNYWIRSFHFCNENAGGPKLDVDITEFYDLWKPDEVPKVLESYKGICSCVNIPDYIQKMLKWSINNHGNEVLAYYDSNCSEEKWKSRLIPAGQWDDSSGISNFKIVDWAENTHHKIQSIGPNRNSSYYKISCNNKTNIGNPEDGKTIVAKPEEKRENNFSQGYEQEEKIQRPQKRMDVYHNMQDMVMFQTNLDNGKPKNNEDMFNLVAKQNELLKKNQDVSQKLNMLGLNLENVQRSINDAFFKLRNEVVGLAGEVEVK